ncbi:MAG: Asp-tRNA(Asn)/Glu-tRNA(Gln) amidotransferase subunit GatB, partial [Erysipelotrichaceae bacterium]|nr:Asp-tRNA(Asn)/Glu-tRNA(Gln) amidotransferase subunit GatB [Erysipelotrichaceae bacterium]
MKRDVVIGIEIHCELKTNSKMFSASRNSINDTPNIHVNEIDLGHPGVLPTLNKRAVELTLRACMLTQCEIDSLIKFDRKNYYYSDLPKGFQITQQFHPIGKNGVIEIEVDQQKKQVRLDRIHMEEDTAKQYHLEDETYIDYNRAGVPLIEIVSKPDMSSAKEAKEYVSTLRNMLIFADVTDGKMEEGSLRCDINISLKEAGSVQFGTKVEIKNIGSFLNVKNAIEYEIKRQTEVLEPGDKVIQETRRFDEREMKTFSMRSKVDSVDYKYFIEPNLPPFNLSKEYISIVKEEIPLLQDERYSKYINEYQLSETDAKTLIKDRKLSDYFEEVINYDIKPIDASIWMVTVILGTLNKLSLDINNLFLSPKMLSDVIKMIYKDELSNSKAKSIIYDAIKEEELQEVKVDLVLEKPLTPSRIMDALNDLHTSSKRNQDGKRDQRKIFEEEVHILVVD